MTDLEHIDVVHTLVDTFRETGDYDYLNTAIALTKEIISASPLTDVRKILQPLLSSLLEMKAPPTQRVQEPVIVTSTAVTQEPLLANSPTVDDSPASTHSNIVEMSNILLEELIELRKLAHPFHETGQFGYIDNSIGLVEEIISAGSPTEATNRLQPLLALFLKVASEPASTNQPAQEPVLHTPPAAHDTAVKPLVEAGIVVKTLLETFCETGDFDYLDNAIAVVLETTVGNPHSDDLEDLLAQLLDIQSRGLAIRQGTEHVTIEGIDDRSEIEIPNQTLQFAVACEDLRILRTKFANSGDIDYINSAIEIAEGILPTISAATASRPAILGYLGTLYHTRYLKSEEVGDLIEVPSGSEDAPAINTLVASRAVDLERAIEAMSDALAAIQPGCKSRATFLHFLGVYLYHRFDRLAVLDDLHNSIVAMEEAVATAASIEQKMLLDLANMLSVRFDQVGALEDLDRAIALTSECATDTSADNPQQADRLRCLWRSHYARFSLLGEVENLDHAILALEEAVATARLPDAANLSNLGSLLTTRFYRLGDMGDYEKAVQISHEALAETTSDHPHRAIVLDTCSNALAARFELQRNIEDLHAAIGGAEEALAMTSPDHPDWATLASNLTIHLNNRHNWLGAPQDNINAMRLNEDVVASPGNLHPGIEAMSLVQLSIFLDRLDDTSLWLGNIDNSISIGEKALAACSPVHENYAKILSSLSAKFLRRFMCERAMTDLEKSIELSERAVAAALPGNYRRTDSLHILCLAFLARFRQLGSPEDLTKAFQANEESGNGFLRGDHVRLHNKSMLLGILFQLVGDRSHIDNAIEFSEQAIAAIPASHLHRAGLLGDLSELLLHRFQSFKEPTDLENGILRAQEAVALCPPRRAARATNLMFLGDGLDARDAEYGPPTVDDIVGTPEHNSGRAIIMSPRCLDVRLETWNCPLTPSRVRIKAARSAAGILVRDSNWEHASSLLADAVELLPTLAPQFLTREDQEKTLSTVSGLASDTLSVALQARFTPADCLSLLELGRGIIMSFAIDCRSDLSDLREQHPEFFHKFNTLRTEIDAPLRLIDVNSDGLANIDVRRLQDEDRRRRRLEAHAAINETLAAIHQLPGFERFQRPPTAEKLMAMAMEGPIVIYNCSELRSDAIIVTGKVIRSLSLPGLIYSEITDRISQFTRLVQGPLRTSARRNIDMAKALLWLWDVAVGPVIEQLGLRAVMEPALDDSKLPRIWWIGVGVLARAPFHAAGDHSLGSTRNTLSHAISSYIPTIKALSYARQKKLDLNTDPRLLLVAMPTTPDTRAIPEIPAIAGVPGIAGTPPIPATATTAAIPRIYGTAPIYQTYGTTGTPAKKWMPLKGALNEIDQIVVVIRESSANADIGCDFQRTPTVIILDPPSVTAVLAELPSYQIIHFACHGVSNERNPSDSNLILLGDRSSEPGKLTVAAIASMNLDKAQIAYLSACSTADNASIDLADESIHIASGFQLAGFSHVLAALWPANDRACQQVAVEFYRRLFNGEPRGHRAVSTAFHYAVKKLRDDNLGQPIKWACFIHTGA